MSGLREDLRVLGTTSADYSMAVEAPAGRIIFISGQIAVDGEGNVLFPGDTEQQARLAFAGVRTLLEEAGGSLDDVVKITTFFTDMRTYPEFAKVRREFFTTPFPASTAVQAASLLKPGLTIEIEAIAVLRPDG